MKNFLQEEIRSPKVNKCYYSLKADQCSSPLNFHYFLKNQSNWIKNPPMSSSQILVDNIKTMVSDEAIDELKKHQTET